MADILMHLDDVEFSFGGDPLFSGLCWEIQDKQRVGFVGANGAGKSTLLRVMMGELPIDGGQVYRASGLTWGHLEQEPQVSGGMTVLEEALTAVPALAILEQKLAQLEEKMGQTAVYSDPDKLARVMAQHERLTAEYEEAGGLRYQSTVKETLTRLGLGAEKWHILTDHLSGGQKKLIMLTKLLVQKPQLLLLDEPDNHLDLPAKQRLEKVIHSYEGCVIIISHDRYLLDEVTTTIAELEVGKINLYHGNYSYYTTERELRRLRQQQLYIAQQKEIARIEAAIARFELWASLVINERHIKQARSRRKMLDKMDKIEKVHESRTMRLEMGGWRGSNKVLELVDVVKWFEETDHLIFEGLNLTIWHGERVGLVGPNGAGKSVLLTQLLDPEGVQDGEIKIGPSIQIGYYDQEHETLDYDRTPLDLIRHTATLSEDASIAFLNRFLFTYRQATEPIGNLSGGERSRLQLATLVLAKPNLLLLDEPTNNLDIPSIEVLEQTLDAFEGTVVVISHDRYFLDQVVDRVVELKDGQLTEFDGGYTDYLAVG